MDIILSKEVTDLAINKVTPRAVQILFASQGLTEKTRLFNGQFDKVHFAKENDSDLKVTFRHSDKPGFMVKTFHAEFVRLLSNDWINSPLLNRSGLASLIWSDNTPNKLRRRLEQKAERGTLTPIELDRITEIVDNFKKDVERSVQIYKGVIV